MFPKALVELWSFYPPDCLAHSLLSSPATVDGNWPCLQWTFHRALLNPSSSFMDPCFCSFPLYPLMSTPWANILVKLTNFLWMPFIHLLRHLGSQGSQTFQNACLWGVKIVIALRGSNSDAPSFSPHLSLCIPSYDPSCSTYLKFQLSLESKILFQLTNSKNLWASLSFPLHPPHQQPSILPGLLKQFALGVSTILASL